jgi:MerR family mercuric resistance operon transcriptional regulator
MHKLNKTAPKPYAIGILSKQTKVPIETIRYYERDGVLPQPNRGLGGQRRYGDEDIRRLVFIRRSRELGFTLKEIESLLGLIEGGHYTCAEVRELTSIHAKEVRQKIADLRRMESVLTSMIAACEAGDVPDCPIVDSLFSEEQSVTSDINA